jgi:hypothetical protein
MGPDEQKEAWELLVAAWDVLVYYEWRSPSERCTALAKRIEHFLKTARLEED